MRAKIVGDRPIVSCGQTSRSRCPRHARGARPVPAPGAGPSAADGGRGGRARQAHREGRPRGQGADDQLEPAAGRLAGPALPGPRPVDGGPGPGGNARPDPRGREVRLAARIQVLHLRDALDPPGDPARAAEPRPDDPGPGPRGPAPGQGPQARERAERQAPARADRRRDRRGGRAPARRGGRAARAQPRR